MRGFLCADCLCQCFLRKNLFIFSSDILVRGTFLLDQIIVRNAVFLYKQKKPLLLIYEGFVMNDVAGGKSCRLNVQSVSQ